MDKLAGPRLFSEFRHICDEDNPLACLVRLDQLGILTAIAPQLALIPTRRGLLQELQDMLSWYHLLYFEKKPQAWLVYFLGLSHGLPYAETSDLYRRLGLPENKRGEILNQREQMRTVRGRLETWQRRQEGQAPKISALCEVLAPLSLESLLYLMAETENEHLQKSLSRYITQWQHEKADITGDDLKALGLPPGPLYSHILRTALKAKLDGETQGREAQLGLARELMRQEQGKKSAILQRNEPGHS